MYVENLEMDNSLKLFFFIKEGGLIIPPWLLLRKMIISQLELGPPVKELVISNLLLDE